MMEERFIMGLRLRSADQTIIRADRQRRFTADLAPLYGNRMAVLLAGYPDSVPANTVNRLCASGLDAIGSVSRGIRAGEIQLGIAGGVESMTRAPFVMGKAGEAFSRSAELQDTTIGWRFIN